MVATFSDDIDKVLDKGTCLILKDRPGSKDFIKPLLGM
jgi:hypothetical protein